MANAPHPYFARTAHPRILAHRGLVTDEMRRDGIAENTIAAFAAADAAGADYIESDCRITADGVVVLCHDDDLARVAGDPRAVAEVSLTQLEGVMASRGGLATLEQALDAFPDARFNIDVKVDEAAEEAGRIVGPEAHRVLLTSFSDRRRRAALRSARNAGGAPATSPGRATISRLVALTRGPAPAALIRRALRGIDAVQIPERHGRIRVLTPRLVDGVHGTDTEVHVWTVNDPADMRRLMDLGVDGIVTDRADVALDVRGG